LAATLPATFTRGGFSREPGWPYESARGLHLVCKWPAYACVALLQRSASSSAQGHWLRDRQAPDEYLEIRIPEAEEPNKVPAGRNPQALVLHRAAWAADSAIKAGMG
jgi:hypothetical protein